MSRLAALGRGAVRQLAVDGEGDVHAADAARHTVIRITPSGAVTPVAAPDGVSVAIAAAGLLIVLA